MADYTSLNQETIERLLYNYPVGSLQSCRKLAGGRANSSQLVRTTCGSYVLSVCDEKSEAEIRQLTDCLDYLGSKNFATTRLVKTTGNESFLLLDGKPVYLKEFIEGEVPETLNEQQAGELGQALACLHLLPPPAGLPTGFSYGLQEFPQVDPASHEHGLWLQDLTPRLQAACHPHLPTGLIHGDLFADNSVYQGNRLLAVLDFEEACNYYLVFDIGMAMVGCCREKGILQPALCRALLTGYLQVRQLQKEEMDSLQDHLIYGAAATSFWRYRQYHLRYPDPLQAEVHLEMRRIAESLCALPHEEFYRIYLGVNEVGRQ